MANTAITKKGASRTPRITRSLLKSSANSLDKSAAAYESFRKGNAKFVDANGGSQSLPGSLNSFLSELSKALNRGKTVTIMRNRAAFTTAEAADLLGVSRQFLVNLLEKNEIPFYLVGTHRRIYAEDLFRYKAARDQHRHRLIRDLAIAEAKEGIYELTASLINGR